MSNVMLSKRLIRYYYENLTYAKLIYGLTERKFKWSSIVFISMYFISVFTVFGLSIYFSNFYSLFKFVLIFIVVNFLWFQVFVIQRRTLHDKWFKSHEDLADLSFSDALFIYRVREMKNQIDLLNISNKQLANIINDIELMRNNQKFKSNVLFAIIGGGLVMGNDSIKALLGSCLSTKDSVILSSFHLFLIAVLIPVIYLAVVPIYTLEYGQWPANENLKLVLRQIQEERDFG